MKYNKLDIKLANFLRKKTSNYLRKKNFDFTNRKVNQVELLFKPYFKYNQKIDVFDIGAHKSTFIDLLLRFLQIEQLLIIEPIPF